MRSKRLFTSITATIDGFINKVENHEAIADCVISDVRSAAARIKIQQGKVRSHLHKLDTEVMKYKKDKTAWEQRALKYAQQDQQKALECIKHKHNIENRLQQLLDQRGQYHSMDIQLETNLTDVEHRLDQLQLKKTALSSRSARTTAISHVNNPNLLHETDQFFERWETNVLEGEYIEGVITDSTSVFEQQILQQEETEKLKNALDDLLSQNSHQDME
ncbi:MAG: PspA/IM30 family protein [Motiliproteus sp.]